MATIGNLNIEPWWKFYWIMKVRILSPDRGNLFLFEFKFYFLSVPIFRNKRQKKVL